ncbi:hypothetical protein FRB95_002769 [Tulasnella sp. JGI-2019a]|nr:hypothetical protein FRB95_002769 [Tulasnella sp. JGI-2019a]
MFTQILAAGLLAFPIVSAGNIIDVFVGGERGLVFTPSNVTANPGDSIRFTFGMKNHTMTQSTFAAPCTGKPGGLFSGYMPVPATQTEGFPEFVVPIQDSTPFWAFCSQGNHCQQGMVFSANAPATGNTFDAYKAAAMASTPSAAVAAPAATTSAADAAAASTTDATAATSSADAAAATTTTTDTTTDGSAAAPGAYGSTGSTDPAAAATTAATGIAAAVTGAATTPVVHTVVVGGSAGLVYTPNVITAAAGDIVMFQFQVKNHTLTQSTFAAPCTEKAGGFDSSFMPVAATDTTFPTYNITVNDTTPIWAYCRQANHCQSGMVFAINPPATGNTFTAFKAGAMNSTAANSTTGTATGAASSYGSGAMGSFNVKLPFVTLAMVSLGFAFMF